MDKKEPKKQMKITKIIKKVKDVVFNQDHSRLALVWTNIQEEVTIDQPPFQNTPEFAPKDPVADGFSLFEAQTMKKVLEFNYEALLRDRNVAFRKKEGSGIARPCLKVKHLALLYKTETFGMVLEEKPF